MKAINVNGQAPGGARTRLAEALPLDTPFVVQIFPVYACNFRCRYCVFSTEVEKRSFISDKVLMDLALYQKCIDEFATFPRPLKTLRFVGMGEPLLHKGLPEMVAYATQKGVARRTEILTNASLLTPAKSDELLAAGLSRLSISLQGMSAAKYKEVCGADVDFDELVAHVRYFYEHRGDCQLYVKIIDCALDGPEEEEAFYRTFGDICDLISVEHAGPIFPFVDYHDVLKKSDRTLTQFGRQPIEARVCPQPFFTFQINPDGKVVPCYSIVYPEILGDCHVESVLDIWNGPKFQAFRAAMLREGKDCCSVCRDCEINAHRCFEEDSLDRDADRLQAIFSCGAGPGCAPAS
jgi:radical SAM protein with 4Fe4S-binding SPASM domain